MTRLDPIGHAFAFRHASDAQISPDAARICFVLTRRDQATDRRVNTLMTTEDRRAWREVPDSTGATGPRWSPDGGRLAFLRRSGSATSVVVADIATGKTRVLADDASAKRDLAWSPNGRQLAWQAHVDDPAPAWVTLPRAADGADRAPPFAVTERLLWRHDSVGDLADGGFQIVLAAVDGSAPPTAADRGRVVQRFRAARRPVVVARRDRVAAGRHAAAGLGPRAGRARHLRRPGRRRRGAADHRTAGPAGGPRGMPRRDNDRLHRRRPARPQRGTAHRVRR